MGNILDGVLTWKENDTLWRMLRSASRKCDRAISFANGIDPGSNVIDPLFDTWDELTDLLSYVNEANESDPIGSWIWGRR